jgi:hypothetical protein
MFVPFQVRKGTTGAWQDASLLARDATKRTLSLGFCDTGEVMSFEATTADAAEGWQFRAAPTRARQMHTGDVSPVRRAGTRRQRADHDVDSSDADRSGSDSYGEDEDVYVVFTQQPVPLVDPVYSRFINYVRAGELHRFKALGTHARLPGTSTYSTASATQSAPKRLCI